MAYPKRWEIYEPLLIAILERGGKARPKDLFEVLADQFGLSSAEREERTEKRNRLRWHVEVSFARQELIDKGYLDGITRNLWRITDEGRRHIHTSLPPAKSLYREYVQQLSAGEAFDPELISDERERALAYVVLRRGQPKFRDQLLTAYGGRCAITGCNVVDILEAAHIVPYKCPKTSHVTNGLLLRADIHALFDLGLVAVDEDAMVVLLSPELARTDYSSFMSRPIALPKYKISWPNRAALKKHRLWSGLEILLRK
jgi:hypothetical protein